KIGSHVRGQVGLVDEQQIAGTDRGATLAGNLVPFGDIDDVDVGVHQLGGEGRGEIVAPAFDENELKVRMRFLQLGHRREVHADIVADRGVRASAGFDPTDAVG